MTRKRRTILIVLLLLIAGGAIGVRLYISARHRAAEQVLADFRAKGYPRSFQELQKWYATPPPEENAALLYEEAFALIPDDELPDPPGMGSLFVEEDLGAVGTLLKTWEPSLALLHKAVALPGSRYSIDLSQGPSGQTLPQMARIREAGRALQIEAVYAATRGDTAGATVAVTAGLRLADSLAQEPLMISQLVRIAVTAMALDGMASALSAPGWTDEQLAALEQQVDGSRTAAHSGLLRAYVGETCSWQYSEHGVGGVASIELAGVLAGMAESPLAERVRFLRTGLQPGDKTNFLKYGVGALALPAMLRGGEYDARTLAQLEIARIAFAVERYRLAKGSLPDTLDALVPEYLPSVPDDPFGNGPYRYIKRNPGYVVYGVGSDGMDNQGRTNRRGAFGPADIVFEVTR